MEPMSKKAYDQGWQNQWDDMKKYGPFSRHLRRLIKDMIRPLEFQSILDVGCGQGSFLEELQAEFPNIKPNGIDRSESAVELARKRVPGGRFSVFDVTERALAEKCDLVVCSEVLEHIPDDMRALDNLRKMTGKYLLISSPQGRMRDFERQVGHVRNYKPGELVSKINSSGFTVLSVVEWGFPFYSPLYRNFLDLTGSKGTTGEYGLLRKTIASIIYVLFSLNSSTRGDEIIVLAAVNENVPARQHKNVTHDSQSQEGSLI